MKLPDKITFRLSPKEAQLLVDQSKAQRVSVHICARMMVEDRLTLTDLEHALTEQGQELANLYESHAALVNEIASLRAGLTAAFEVLFVQVAKIDQQEAQDWLEGAFQHD